MTYSYHHSENFPLNFEEFAARYGRETIEKPSQKVTLAKAEQVAEITRLTSLLKTDSSTIEKWLEKANAESFAEFSEAQADKVIEHLNKQLTSK